MRNSGLLKWAQNNKNNKLSNGKTKEEKKWIHSPDTLVQGHVAYLVKFLGSTEVDKPKGIDVVKQGIQKLKFNQQLRKSEAGSSAAKTPKVELTISVDGVAIQEPKTKRLLHQYPLHKISYCADDKAEKRFFSFIAKEGDAGSQHTCFVFVSDKLAEEITLTIGQAFELAYKKFLDTSGKELETKKQLMVMQKRIALLEAENVELKKRLRDVASIKGQQDVQEYMHKLDITDITEVRPPSGTMAAASSPNSNTPAVGLHEIKSAPQLCPNNNITGAAAATAAINAPPRSKDGNKTPALISLEAAAPQGSSTKLDGFTLDDLNDDDFNPRASTSTSEDDEEDDEEDEADFNPRAIGATEEKKKPQVILAPPALPPREPPAVKQEDIFKATPGDPFSGNPFASDPFGMATFNAGNAKGGAFDTFQASFKKVDGASFSLDELDPLKQ